MEGWERDNKLGKFLREKSVDAVIDEFVEMKRKYKIKRILAKAKRKVYTSRVKFERLPKTVIIDPVDVCNLTVPFAPEGRENPRG